MTIGTLYGIGMGPGDPELITVKGLKRLQQAAIVAFPAGVHGNAGMAEQGIAPWLTPTQRRLPLAFPYVRDLEVMQAAWSQAAEQVWHYLQTGQDVVFVSEGDISFYSTFTYLAQTLQHIHPEARVEAIPGVCSPLAAAAALGEPLTIRQQKLAVIPAIYNVAELEAVLQWAEVVVLMKVSSVYAEVWHWLQRHGLLERSQAIAWVSLPQQQIYHGLQNYPNLQLPYFSLLIIRVTEGSGD